MIFKIFHSEIDHLKAFLNNKLFVYSWNYNTLFSQCFHVALSHFLKASTPSYFFLGSTSFQIQNMLQLFADKLVSFNLKIIFMLPIRWKSKT